MNTLGNLLELYSNGALNIKYEHGCNQAVLGGVDINTEGASIICNKLGWTEFYLHPFEIIEKTAKFIKSFKVNSLHREVLCNIAVEFQNKRSNNYGKTFDRIHLEMNRYFNISILYGMAGNESPYIVYDGIKSIPLKKCRNMKQIVEYIDSLIG